jgi:hypothetical protein
MLTTNPRYQSYLGIENTQQSISFADLAKIIRDNITSGPARAMVLFTAYVNGHDDNSVFTFNFDLGNTPLGGVTFPKQINYAGREKYFQKQFGCKINQNGFAQPSAVFTTSTSGESFTNSVKFINDYYVSDGALVLLPPKPSSGYYKFNYTTKTWEDNRNIEDVRAHKRTYINQMRLSANQTSFTFQGKEIAEPLGSAEPVLKNTDL